MQWTWRHNQTNGRQGCQRWKNCHTRRNRSFRIDTVKRLINEVCQILVCFIKRMSTKSGGAVTQSVTPIKGTMKV